MVSKEFVEERRGFGLAYTANHLDRMIQTSVTHHIAYRPASPRFWIPRAKHEPWDARQNNRARAHGAWFERDGEGAAIKAPCAQRSSGLPQRKQDRKSTRLNSSHVAISYAVFCLKKRNDES